MPSVLAAAVLIMACDSRIAVNAETKSREMCFIVFIGYREG
jgi:hypothetical protein